MLKVAENLKCKHGLWCVSKQNEKTFGAFVCQLNYKECKDVCERFINKFKEWNKQKLPDWAVLGLMDGSIERTE